MFVVFVVKVCNNIIIFISENSNVDILINTCFKNENRYDEKMLVLNDSLLERSIVGKRNL